MLDELLHRRSTSPIEPLYLFLLLDLLPNKTDRKQIFNIVLITSCPFASNYAREEVDLNFADCGCPASIILNWLWQLERLHPKLVSIIDAIFFVAAIFWNLLFVSCYCHSVKLAFKLVLEMQGIASGMIKKRIKMIWPNKTISQLDQLFWSNTKWWIRTAIIYTQPDA